jgi:hypothetical protein
VVAEGEPAGDLMKLIILAVVNDILDALTPITFPPEVMMSNGVRSKYSPPVFPDGGGKAA